MDVRGSDLSYSLKRMSHAGKGRYEKTPFVGVPYNTGSTTFPKNMTNLKKRDMQYSFGTAHQFMRFSLTSAINQEPYCYVSFVKYQATRAFRTTFEGKLTKKEWTSGPRTPRTHYQTNPFVPCDDFIPSRFVMAHSDCAKFNDSKYDRAMDIAFIAMDPERVGECNDDGGITDLGDNVLQYQGGDISIGETPRPYAEREEVVDDGTLKRRRIHPNLEKFLSTKHFKKRKIDDGRKL